ncbi:hypothetical protein [Sinorhizobium sojae]|nr:hypothetical protein [Sinorhizobium sojae]
MEKAVVLAFCLNLAAGAVLAQDGAILPPNIIFVTSTGFWEESASDIEAGADDEATEPGAATGRRGYYKLVALRRTDGTAEIHLQQIASTPAGPEIVSSAELEEFTALKPYVTDIRPETSTGVTHQPGMFATVYLKTDPSAAEPESWSVLIDELGDIKIERATN